MRKRISPLLRERLGFPATAEDDEITGALESLARETTSEEGAVALLKETGVLPTDPQNSMIRSVVGNLGCLPQYFVSQCLNAAVNSHADPNLRYAEMPSILMSILQNPCLGTERASDILTALGVCAESAPACFDGSIAQFAVFAALLGGNLPASHPVVGAVELLLPTVNTENDPLLQKGSSGIVSQSSQRLALALARAPWQTPAGIERWWSLVGRTKILGGRIEPRVSGADPQSNFDPWDEVFKSPHSVPPLLHEALVVGVLSGTNRNLRLGQYHIAKMMKFWTAEGFDRFSSANVEEIIGKPQLEYSSTVTMLLGDMLRHLPPSQWPSESFRVDWLRIALSEVDRIDGLLDDILRRWPREALSVVPPIAWSSVLASPSTTREQRIQLIRIIGVSRSFAGTQLEVDGRDKKGHKRSPV